MPPSTEKAGFDPKGAIRFGPYEVVRYVSEGGMAWVYEARDPRFPARRLALKVLKPAAGDGEAFQRFEAEAKLLAGVDHPNLVTIFDLDRDPESGLAYYTMTFVEGKTLFSKQPLPWRDAVEAFLGVLEGLAELHDRGVIHRDIKPGNMLRHRDGRVLLADLGIARDPAGEGLTRVGAVIGTPAYMPPEQAAGQTVDARADLFGIGMAIYRVCTGRTLYDTLPDVNGRNGQAILSHLAGCSSRRSELEFPFPSDLPEGLREVIRRACRFRPEDRFPSARAFHAELAALLENDSRAGWRSTAPSVPVISSALDPTQVNRIGPYEVTRYVAEGGMGWVFEVRAPEAPDRRLALKALKPSAGTEDELRRFRAEADLLTGLEHPNLVGVLDAGVDDETRISYYTMPFIDSEPLRDRKRMPLQDALRVVDGVLTALAELHRRGIVHRDVKPANILLRENGTPVLTDLGIARNSKQATMTSSGIFLGTALYCSPEQARGARTEAASDVFSVGLLLHALVTGASPYDAVEGVDAANDASILFHLAKLEHGGDELAIELPDSVPPAVQGLIFRACRYHAEDRFEDALAMRTALRAARRDPSRVFTVHRSASRRGRRAVLAALAVAAAVGVGFALRSTGLDWRVHSEKLWPDARLIGKVREPATRAEAAAGLAARGTAAHLGTEGHAPLTLASRTPADDRVTAERGASVRFAIEPETGAEIVRTAWFVDGQAMAEGTREFVLTPSESARVEVLVGDRFGSELRTDWQVEIGNQLPRLALIPASRQVDLEVGDVRTFAARASDPDGDPVTVEFRLNGQIVARGTSFVFAAQRPGLFRLEARARDGHGGEVEVDRAIRVARPLRKPSGFDSPGPARPR